MKRELMRTLLDTIIIIHRESLSATNYSIGRLYYWLDKINYENLIHPLSLKELRKANNSAQQNIYNTRLAAYTEMKNKTSQTSAFQALLMDDLKRSEANRKKNLKEVTLPFSLVDVYRLC